VGLNNKVASTPKDKSGKVADVYPWGTQWPPPKGAGNFAGSEAEGPKWSSNLPHDEGYGMNFPPPSAAAIAVPTDRRPPPCRSCPSGCCHFHCSTPPPRSTPHPWATGRIAPPPVSRPPGPSPSARRKKALASSQFTPQTGCVGPCVKPGSSTCRPAVSNCHAHRVHVLRRVMPAGLDKSLEIFHAGIPHRETRPSSLAPARTSCPDCSPKARLCWPPRAKLLASRPALPCCPLPFPALRPPAPAPSSNPFFATAILAAAKASASLPPARVSWPPASPRAGLRRRRVVLGCFLRLGFPGGFPCSAKSFTLLHSEPPCFSSKAASALSFSSA